MKLWSIFGIAGMVVTCHMCVIPTYKRKSFMGTLSGECQQISLQETEPFQRHPYITCLIRDNFVRIHTITKHMLNVSNTQLLQEDFELNGQIETSFNQPDPIKSHPLSVYISTRMALWIVSRMLDDFIIHRIHRCSHVEHESTFRYLNETLHFLSYACCLVRFFELHQHKLIDANHFDLIRQLQAVRLNTAAIVSDDVWNGWSHSNGSFNFNRNLQRDYQLLRTVTSVLQTAVFTVDHKWKHSSPIQLAVNCTGGN